MRPKVVLFFTASVVLLYVGTAVYVLRFHMDRVLFPATAAEEFSAADVEQVVGASGNELLVRRYGPAENGCVAFFPGQHGNLPSYEQQLFPAFTTKGVAVFSLAYPGQDGAAGRGTLDEIQILIARAVAVIAKSCRPDRTVFVGHSLGSMLAAYATNQYRPAGLMLDSAAPSLSAAVRTALRSHWASRPLGELPLSILLPHDYSLAEALAQQPGLPVMIFQGTEDTQTPISDLLEADTLPRGVALIPVPGATHANVHLVAGGAYVDAVLSMLETNSIQLIP